MTQVVVARASAAAPRAPAGRCPAWCAARAWPSPSARRCCRRRPRPAASPSFTASIARPIEVVLARRIAWLGFSVAGDDVVAMDDLDGRRERRVLAELGADRRLVAEQEEAEVGAALMRAGGAGDHHRRARRRRPSRRLRSVARCPPVPSPVQRLAVLGLGRQDFAAVIVAAAGAQIVRQLAARRNSGIPGTVVGFSA